MPEAADRTIKLGDILSPAQCNEVALIFKTSADTGNVGHDPWRAGVWR